MIEHVKDIMISVILCIFLVHVIGGDDIYLNNLNHQYGSPTAEYKCIGRCKAGAFFTRIWIGGTF